MLLQWPFSYSCQSLSNIAASESRDVAVCFQRGQQDVDQPEAKEKQGCQYLASPWTAELSSSHWGAPAIQQYADSHHSHRSEERDGEGQRARLHEERFALGTPVYSSNGPRHTDAQENIDSVAARHIANGGVSILVLDGSNLTGKSVCAKRGRIQSSSD